MSNDNVVENVGVETVDSVDSNEFDTLVSRVNFERRDSSAKRERLEKLQAQVAELETEVKVAEKEASTMRRQALKVARSLAAQGLNSESILAVLRLQFETSKKPRAAETSERKSHKIDQSVQEQILEFLRANPEGVSVNQVWEAFNNEDRLGVAMVVRKYVELGSVRTEGKTRQCKYFPVVA